MTVFKLPAERLRETTDAATKIKRPAAAQRQLKTFQVTHHATDFALARAEEFHQIPLAVLLGINGEN